MKDRNQIIAEHPLEQYLESRGVKVQGSGAEIKCRCPLHEDKEASMTVNISKGLWRCWAGCGAGSVIDMMALVEGVSAKVIMKRLGEDGYIPPKKEFTPKPESSTPKFVSTPETPPSEKPKLVKTYDYRNAKGDLVYQACRLEPKSFRQRRPVGDDKWVWNMEGIERVLYQLPKTIKTNKPIVVCEGEKDADNITNLAGWVGTTNVGGAGKWLEAYTESLLGKEVILCGDNDKPGKEHMDKIFESLAGKVKSVRVVKVPAPHKDVSDWLASFADQSPENLHGQFAKLVDDSAVFDKGLNIPIQSMAEIEVEFRQSIARAETHSLDFTKWLPSLGKAVRPMVGGEVIAILAGTGVGKSALASNISMHAAPLHTLFFQQELPGSLMFERLVAMGTATPTREVFHQYKSGQPTDWRSNGRLNHIFVCTHTRMTPQKIEELIIKSELKIGERPAFVVVDYIQLMGGKEDRREKVADSAEGLKVVAKNTNTIICILSQIKRKGKDGGVEVTLEDGKEAGEIENSSGLVLGAWRDVNDPALMHLKVLKNTKGFAGKQIPCNFDGERLIITERADDNEPDQEQPVSAPHNDP